MTASAAAHRDDRRWYFLALRHLRMAARLLRDGFADGAVFHAYHAYECVLSAFIAANGYSVPPDGSASLSLPSGKKVKAYPSPQGWIREINAHKARIVFFNELADQTQPYYSTHQLLSKFMTYDDRLHSLYYDPVSSRLPHQWYPLVTVSGLLPLVHQFAREIRPVLT